jgi:vacuolar protein sorting-associated protein VTA1
MCLFFYFLLLIITLSRTFVESSSDMEELHRLVGPYVKLAGQLEANDPVAAYHVQLYAVQIAVEQRAGGGGADVKRQVAEWMDGLEVARARLDAPETAALMEEPRARAHLLALVGRLFKAADDADRAGRATANTVRQFYSASNLLDVVQQLFELGVPLEMADWRKYARWRAAELSKVVAANAAQPQAHPPRAQAVPPSYPPPAADRSEDGRSGTTHSAAVWPLDSPQALARPSAAAGAPPLTPSPGVVAFGAAGVAAPVVAVSVEDMQRAQKYARFAVSALEFDDVAYAIQNLEAALVALKR